MGIHKFKRPILATEGVQAGETTSPSTFSSPVTVAGVFTLSSGIVLSVSTHSAAAGAAASLGNKTVNLITMASSGAGRDFVLPDPVYRGQVRYIFVDNQTTSIDTHIVTSATARTFWGTTYNDASLAAASTGSPGGTPAATVALELVAASTTQWAVMPGSTYNWDFSASTGATG